MSTTAETGLQTRPSSQEDAGQGANGKALISLDGITKVFYTDEVETHALSDVHLDIKEGEYLAIAGPSGCGKTTALRMVAGLEEITSGTLEIGERVVNDIAPKDRDIAMVFQSYALYPHLSVYENIPFGLKIKKLPQEGSDRRPPHEPRIPGAGTAPRPKPRALHGGRRRPLALIAG